MDIFDLHVSASNTFELPLNFSQHLNRRYLVTTKWFLSRLLEETTHIGIMSAIQ